MDRSYWTLTIAFACVFWGIAILICQHHMGSLILVLAGYLLAYGIGLVFVFFRNEKRQQ
jgi:hypothetical protein